MFAFADDLAVVLTMLVMQLAGLGVMFEKWAAASGLVLKARKCVLLPLWISDDYSSVRALVDGVGVFSGMAIASSARYLGLQVGTNSAQDQWDAVVPKLLSRSLDVASTRATLYTKVRLWNVHGAGLLAYKSRFVELNPAVLQAFRRATQRMCQAPWMAFPSQVLLHGDLLGGVALRDPVRMGRAARWHVIRTSAVLHAAWDDIDRAAESDEAALAAVARGDYRRQWHRGNSIIVMLRVERRRLEAFDRMTPITSDATADIYRVLGDGEDVRRRELDAVLRRRMSRWDALLRALFVFVTIKPPLELLCSVLRTALYGWCTSARFRSGRNRCLSGCGAAEVDSCGGAIGLAGLLA